MPTTTGPDVGDIATPHLIGLLDIKLAGQQIGNVRSFRLCHLIAVCARLFGYQPGFLELLSNVVYGVGQAAFLSDSSSTWTPSLNFTLFTTNVSSTNPLSRFHFFCAASSSL